LNLLKQIVAQKVTILWATSSFEKKIKMSLKSSPIGKKSPTLVTLDPVLQNFLQPYFMNVCNKLGCLPMASLSSYPCVEPLKGASLRSATTLLTNIRLGRKGIPGTNTLAYYELSLNYGHKMFHNIGPC
jgi:hypothetical protein